MAELAVAYAASGGGPGDPWARPIRGADSGSARG